MSAEALTWAWRQHDLKPGERFVLVALADRANHEGVCWPSHHDLAARTGYSTRQVMRNLEKLADVGLIEVLHRRGQSGRQTSHLYVMHFERGRGYETIGRTMHQQAKARANLPRPGGKPVDRSVDRSTGEWTECHPVNEDLEPPEVSDYPRQIVEYDEGSLSQMSPLELTPELKPVVTHVSTTRQAVDKERASLPADTRKARSPDAAEDNAPGAPDAPGLDEGAQARNPSCAPCGARRGEQGAQAAPKRELPPEAREALEAARKYVKGKTGGIYE